LKGGRIAKIFYRINHYIKADKLRVVDETAAQIGILTKDEALARAQQAGLDLVEVAPNANPPVAKIIDFAKFKYQLKQKTQISKKGSRAQDIKEIRLTPFIAENDFNVRINKAAGFLTQGDKVRLVVKFVGRQITRREFGDKLLAKATDKLSELATVESHPNLRGKLLMTILTPSKKTKIHENS